MIEQLELEAYAREMGEAAGRSGRRSAIAAVADADREWLDHALAEISRLARTGRAFDAQDLRRAVGAGPSPGSLGAVFRIARGEGLIRSEGYRRSNAPTRHGSPIAIWRGVE